MLNPETIYKVERAICPNSTLSNTSALLKKIGITRIANITGLDSIGLPIFQSIRPSARSIAVSSGKGLTEDAARVSAVMESVEGHYAERHKIPIQVNTLQEVSKSENTDWLKNLFRAKSVLDSDEPIKWVSAINLINRKELKIPYGLVHLDMRPSYSEPFFEISSNGLASGNSIAEAQLHGINELVERHATMQWKLKTTEAKYLTKIDIPDSLSSCLLDIISKIADSGLELHLFDFTTELEIPVCCAMIIDPEIKKGGLHTRLQYCTGYGCSLYPDVAMVRAITEAAQERAGLISASRDDFSPDLYKPNYKSTIFERPYQTNKLECTHRFASRTPSTQLSVEGSLQTVINRLFNQRIDKIFSVTIADIDKVLSVVRIVIPFSDSASSAQHHAIDLSSLESVMIR